jgi:Flp pilus assembly protein TadG
MTRPMGTEMKRLLPLRSMASDERGVAAILVALVILVLLGFAALAIDIGHLFAVRNELQNAADAGALAGARFLYNDDGTAVNTGANQIGYDAATANVSDTGSGSEVAVEVNWTAETPGMSKGDIGVLLTTLSLLTILLRQSTFGTCLTKNWMLI